MEAASSISRFDLRRRQRLGFEARISVRATWKGGRLEYWHCEPEPLDECVLSNDLIALNLGPDQRCQAKWRGFGLQPGTMREQSITVLPAHVPYSIDQGNRFRGLVLALDRRELTDGRMLRAGPEFRPAISSQDDFSRATLMALHADALQNIGAGPLYGECLLVALSAHLAARYGLASTPAPREERLLSATQRRALEEFIHERIDDPPALTDLSDRLHMDKFRFLRTFSRTYGVTPQRFILAMRVERAKELLRSSRVSIAEIALCCGFNDQSHFATTFRKHVGLTPTRYRLET